jgi:hypothetical protein
MYVLFMWQNQGVVLLYNYIKCRPLPSLHDFGHVDVLSAFSNISAAAAADISRSSQLSIPVAGQAVQYVMAGGTARPSQFKSSPPHPSKAGQGAVLDSILYGLWGQNTTGAITLGCP